MIRPLKREEIYMFNCAVPVWKKYDSFDDAQNRHLIFREKLPSLGGVTLSVAASDFYRLRVSGEFVGFGPARAALGYARVDEYDLSEYDRDGECEIVLEVAGYHCKSLATVWQSSFLCAELKKEGKVLKYTGRDFPCYENLRRVRYVERYSVQRHYGEIYDGGCGEIFVKENLVSAVPIDEVPIFIPRHVPRAFCAVRDVREFIARGVFCEAPNGRDESGEFGTGKKKNAYSFELSSEPGHGFFPEDKIPDKPYRYIASLDKKRVTGSGILPVSLNSGEWITVDFGMIQAGFLRFEACISEDADIVLAFSELCEGDTFSHRAVNFQGVIEYKLPRGRYTEESFEPYSFRHVCLFVKRGAMRLDSVGYRTFERDTRGAKRPSFAKTEHEELYNTALRTFAHNAVDILTDCPSRERAGWLCDSYFMGKAEYFFFGETPAEDNFLENYVSFKNGGSYPEGVLPMCYPGDPIQGSYFIPQWNMWYVLEVCEYLDTRRPDIDKSRFIPSVFGVLDFLKKYENSDGLLERLPSFNFVEWSDANSWTKDVSYPTNFLYAGILDAVAVTFSRPELSDKAERVRKKTAELSFNGELFVDHAKRDTSGTLVNQMHISEACQYYAILFGKIDLAEPKYAALRANVVNDFSDFEPGNYTFCPKNAFIGLYLRMAVLLSLGDRALLEKNLEVFLPMCKKTGTLWEFRDGRNSLDHGFASYVALTIPRHEN